MPETLKIEDDPQHFQLTHDCEGTERTETLPRVPLSMYMQTIRGWAVISRDESTEPALQCVRCGLAGYYDGETWVAIE